MEDRAAARERPGADGEMPVGGLLPLGRAAEREGRLPAVRALKGRPDGQGWREVDGHRVAQPRFLPSDAASGEVAALDHGGRARREWRGMSSARDFVGRRRDLARGRCHERRLRRPYRLSRQVPALEQRLLRADDRRAFERRLADGRPRDIPSSLPLHLEGRWRDMERSQPCADVLRLEHDAHVLAAEGRAYPLLLEQHGAAPEARPLRISRAQRRRAERTLGDCLHQPRRAARRDLRGRRPHMDRIPRGGAQRDPQSTGLPRVRQPEMARDRQERPPDAADGAAGRQDHPAVRPGIGLSHLPLRCFLALRDGPLRGLQKRS